MFNVGPAFFVGGSPLTVGPPGKIEISNGLEVLVEKFRRELRIFPIF